MALEHLNTEDRAPARTLILGAGFVGRAIARGLAARGAEFEALSSADLDLLGEGAAAGLADRLTPETALVVASARAPVKTEEMLLDNLRMLLPLRDAMATVRPAHLVYISSDAVYADRSEPLNEDCCAEPSSLHGVMHLAREVALADTAGEIPLAIVRPSLLYGPGDPHNGYGPNRFRRLAAAGKEIVLFGKGEERRDHVYIDDVGELITRVILRRSRGVINIATGNVVSFRDLAEKASELAAVPVPIRSTPRQGLMPHNGYRAFDPTSTTAAFPDFVYTDTDNGMARARDAELSAPIEQHLTTQV